MNGNISTASSGGFAVSVMHAYGSCLRYVNMPAEMPADGEVLICCEVPAQAKEGVPPWCCICEPDDVDYSPSFS
jgi:hypothetical protein